VDKVTSAAWQRCENSHAGTALLLAQNTAQSTNVGEQSRRFLAFLGITKQKVMVCALSWFLDLKYSG
jgi:hypothetical protein